MPSRPASRMLSKPPEWRIPGWRPPPPPGLHSGTAPWGPGFGSNWGSSGPYRAANPDYQNCSSSAKMRITSVLCGASSA